MYMCMYMCVYIYIYIHMYSFGAFQVPTFPNRTGARVNMRSITTDATAMIAQPANSVKQSTTFGFVQRVSRLGYGTSSRPSCKR